MLTPSSVLLSLAMVLKPDFSAQIYEATPPSLQLLKIMPLGDSITAGGDEGAYRADLWNQLQAGGFNVDFVGSLSDGPDHLGDKNHEGHPGWTINRIAGSVNGWLNTYQPDIILMMLGTNDLRSQGDSPTKAANDLNALIDQVTGVLPGSQLLVSSITPADPDRASRNVPSDLDRLVEDFNSLIPGIVKAKVNQGKNVTFVDASGDLTHPNDLSDDVHANAQGYSKMADAWFAAIVRKTA